MNTPRYKPRYKPKYEILKKRARKLSQKDFQKIHEELTKRWNSGELIPSFLVQQIERTKP